MQPTQNRPPNHRRRECDNLARDLDAERALSDQRIGVDPEEPEYYPGSPPVVPPSYARYSDIDGRPLSSRRSSGSKRVFRTAGRFAFAVIVGVVTTLGFQSYHDKASAMIRTAAPSLAWLLSVSATHPPVSSATLPELVEQLKPISLDLAIVRRSLEQVAANQTQLANNQEQIVKNLTTMQEVEQEIRQGVRTPLRKSSPSTGQPLR
jgi:hypothetical protein